MTMAYVTNHRKHRNNVSSRRIVTRVLTTYIAADNADNDINMTTMSPMLCKLTSSVITVTKHGDALIIAMLLIASPYDIMTVCIRARIAIS